jgi:hypothetical protein
MNTLRRELRVAFSRHAQPVWLRVIKWIVFIGVTIALRASPYLWAWVFGLPLVGVVVHMVFRWKTKGWRRAWGGWNDLAAGKE